MKPPTDARRDALRTNLTDVAERKIAEFRRRRESHVAAVVVARKLAVLILHMLTKAEDCAWSRPTLMARKLRALDTPRAMQPEMARG